MGRRKAVKRLFGLASLEKWIEERKATGWEYSGVIDGHVVMKRPLPGVPNVSVVWREQL